MLNILQLLPFFCIILTSTADCDSSAITWNDASFVSTPTFLEMIPTTLNDLADNSVITLLPGPVHETNLLWLVSSMNSSLPADKELQMLNSSTRTSASVISNFDNLASVKNVKIVATADGSITLLFVANDTRNLSQIHGYTFFSDQSTPRTYVLTNNTNSSMTYRIEALLADRADPFILYSQLVKESLDNGTVGNITVVTLYAAKISTRDQLLKKNIKVANGNFSHARCDVVNEPEGVLCLLRVNNSLFSTLITNEAIKTQFLFQDSSENKLMIKYYPEAVVAAQGFIAGIFSARRKDEIFLMIQKFELDGFRDEIANPRQALPVKNFPANGFIESPFIGSAAYSDKIALFYTAYGDGGCQRWSYTMYDINGIRGSEVHLANVGPDSYARFQVSGDVGCDAINIVAYSADPSDDSPMVSIFYGVILDHTFPDRF